MLQYVCKHLHVETLQGKQVPEVSQATSIITIMCVKECLLPANFFKNMIWVILSELFGIILKLLLGRLPEKWLTRAQTTLHFVELHANAALWH